MTVNLPLQTPGRLIGGLESVARTSGLSEEQWRTGVNYTMECVGEVGVWGCGPGPDADANFEKVVGSIAAAEAFYPGLAYALAQCGNGSSSGPLGDAAAISAGHQLDRLQYRRIAQILMDGDVAAPEGDNPNFIQLGQLPAGYNDAAPSGILPAIEGLIADGRALLDPNFVIHVAREFLPFFLSGRIVELGDDGVYRMGDIRFVFDEYQNVGPAGTTTKNDGSEVWMYLSSQPIIELGAVDVVEARAVRLNERQVRAERGVLAMFDPCHVGAAKAVVCS